MTVDRKTLKAINIVQKSSITSVNLYGQFNLKETSQTRKDSFENNLNSSKRKRFQIEKDEGKNFVIKFLLTS